MNTYITKNPDKCCCSCEHNIRTSDNIGEIECHCEIDNHYIGYISCFENSCKRWKKSKKWEESKESEE